MMFLRSNAYITEQLESSDSAISTRDIYRYNAIMKYCVCLYVSMCLWLCTSCCSKDMYFFMMFLIGINTKIQEQLNTEMVYLC